MSNNVTTQISGISLFNIGLNAYGQIRRKKKVSIWTMDNPPREVLVGNVINNTSRTGQAVAETLSRGTVVMSCQADEPSKLCEHPIESGSVITEHKILEPRRCTVTLAMPAYFQDVVIKELREYHKKSTPLSVHDVADIYNNMIITNIPHTTDAKTADRLVFNIEMKEVFTVSPQYVVLDVKKVQNPKNASTVKKGVKQAKTNTSILQDIKTSSVFNDALDKIKSFWGNQ